MTLVIAFGTPIVYVSLSTAARERRQGTLKREAVPGSIKGEVEPEDPEVVSGVFRCYAGVSREELAYDTSRMTQVGTTVEPGDLFHRWADHVEVAGVPTEDEKAHEHFHQGLGQFERVIGKLDVSLCRGRFRE